MADDFSDIIVHASCVSWQGQAVLITGSSGTGKSALALQLMAMGAALVADDRTVLHENDGMLFAAAPEEIRGLIEARGVGLLKATVADAGQVCVVIKMDEMETKRFPDKHEVEICGVTLQCLKKVDQPSFPAAILQYLKAGRWEPT